MKKNAEETIKIRFKSLFVSWIFFISTIVFFFFVAYLYSLVTDKKSNTVQPTPVPTPLASTTPVLTPPPVTITPAPETSPTPAPTPTASPTTVPTPTTTSTPISTTTATGKKTDPDAIFQLKEIRTEKLNDGGIEIFVSINHPIKKEDYKENKNSINVDEPVYYIDFLGKWEEPKRENRISVKGDIVKTILTDKTPRKERPYEKRLSVRLRKKIKAEDIKVNPSPDGLIITIKSLDNGVKKGDGDNPNPKKPLAQFGSGTPPVTSENQILDIKPDPSEENFKLTVLTNHFIKEVKDYTYSISNEKNPKFYIKFNQKWEIPENLYPKGDDIVKKIESSPDKMGLIFHLRQQIELPVVESKQEGLLVTIKNPKILDIKEEPSGGEFKITVSTNNPIGKFSYLLKNERKLHIEFNGKWGKKKEFHKGGKDDILEDVKINNESPDKTKIVFCLKEDIQDPAFENIDQGLIILIRKAQ